MDYTYCLLGDTLRGTETGGNMIISDKKYVEKIPLACLPTRIEKLEKTSAQYGKNIFIKRDDQTGTELSGNKIRKLEYAVAEARGAGCDVLITCGGIQSNHCRATAAVAVKQDMHCILVLAGDPPASPDGNLLLDYLFGAEVRFIPPDRYEKERQAVMESIVQELAAKGKKGYIIPMGASNGIGAFGYFDALNEIVLQETAQGIRFDTIVCTVGSGGTYAGLCAGNKIHSYKKHIIGFSISESSDFFTKEIIAISKEFYAYRHEEEALTPHDICIVDGYAGRGYALNTQEELAFIRRFAASEGIVLDPVYTGKAMYGLCSELESGSALFKDADTILFIHTGGLFGLFPKREELTSILPFRQ